MKKGNKRKLEIQQTTKELIIQKGYPYVTMSDISRRLNLSAGGLYHHYHSIEEIFLDILLSETSDIWSIFTPVDDLESLIIAFRKYHSVEKKDMLNINNTLNDLLYQYYFSFSATERKEKLYVNYEETMRHIKRVLGKVYSKPEVIDCLSNHIYITLHGLTLLAMTGQLTELIIDFEFSQIELMMKHLYSENEDCNEK